MDLVLQLVGVPILVPPQPHQRLARRDRSDPAPETSLTSILPQVPADLEEGLLHDVFCVFRGAADPAGEIVDRRLKGAVELLQCGDITGPGLGQDYFCIG